jgi:hypothetical protein
VIVAPTGAARASRTAALVRGAGDHPSRTRVRGLAAAKRGTAIAIAAVATAAFAARATATATRTLASITAHARRPQASEPAAGRVAAGPYGPTAAPTTSATTPTAAATFAPATAATIVAFGAGCAGPRHHVDGVIEVTALLDALDGLFAGEHAHEADALCALAGNGQRLHEARQPIAGDVERGADRVGHGTGSRGGLGRRLGGGSLGAGRLTIASSGIVSRGRESLVAIRCARFGRRSAFGGGCITDVGSALGDLCRFGGSRVFGRRARGRGIGTACFGRGGSGRFGDGGFVPLHGRAHAALDVGGLTEQSSSEFGDGLHNPPLGRALGRCFRR